MQNLAYTDTKVQGYKLTGSLEFAMSTIQRYKNSRMAVGVKILHCPGNKFAKTTIQRYKKSRVDVGVTNLRYALDICKVYHTTIPKFKGGRWRYKLRM